MTYGKENDKKKDYGEMREEWQFLWRSDKLVQIYANKEWKKKRK